MSFLYLGTCPLIYGYYDVSNSVVFKDASVNQKAGHISILDRTQS
jgi:hypothetical protein